MLMNFLFIVCRRIEELLGKIDYNEPEIETLMNMLNRIIARQI